MAVLLTERVWISAPAPSTAISAADRGHADIDQPAALHRRRVARHQRRLAEHDLLQQARQEVAAARLGPQRRRALRVDAEAARHRAGQPVDRRAFLRAGGEIDAAQERCRIEPRAAERLAARTPPAGFAGWRPAPGSRRWRCARRALRSACSRSSRRSFRRCTSRANSVAKAAAVPASDLFSGKVMPQTCAALLAVQVVEELHEAGDQVGLGEQRVDRHAHAKLVGQFLDAAADGAGMRQPLGLRGGGDVGQRDRDHHAVQRLPRAGCASAARGTRPSPPCPPRHRYPAWCSGRRCRSAPRRR